MSAWLPPGMHESVLTIHLLLQEGKTCGTSIEQRLKERAGKVKLKLYMYTKEQVSNLKIISGIQKGAI